MSDNPYRLSSEYIDKCCKTVSIRYNIVDGKIIFPGAIQIKNSTQSQCSRPTNFCFRIDLEELKEEGDYKEDI